MRHGSLVVLVAAMVLATSAVGFCQSARSVGMGMTGVGLADDAAAWIFNPAGLPYLNAPVAEGNELGMQAIVGMDFESDQGMDQDFIHVGATDGSMGFAVGRMTRDDIGQRMVGGGFGAKFSDNWSWGVSLISVEQRGYDEDEYEGPSPVQVGARESETILNAGLMYRWTPGWAAGNPAKLSVLAADLNDEMGEGVLWNAGISTNIGSKLLLVVDVLDIADDTAVPGVDKSGTMFNVGVEYPLLDWLAVRVGSQDGDFGFGVGADLGNGWTLDAGSITFDWGVGPDADMRLASISKVW